MNKQLKTKWVKALRSGTIKQGRGGLLDAKGRMCCIGVLGRIRGLSDKTLLKCADSLSGEGLKKLEFLGDEARRLAAMNDGTRYNGGLPKKHNFKQIAAWIEANL